MCIIICMHLTSIVTFSGTVALRSIAKQNSFRRRKKMEEPKDKKEQCIICTKKAESDDRLVTLQTYHGKRYMKLPK